MKKNSLPIIAGSVFGIIVLLYLIFKYLNPFVMYSAQKDKFWARNLYANRNEQVIQAIVINPELTEKEKQEFSDNSKKKWKENRDSIISAISVLPNVNIVNRDYLNNLKKELAFQFSDYSDAKKSVELGNVFNADVFIDIRPQNDDKVVINIIDINTLKIETHSISTFLSYGFQDSIKESMFESFVSEPKMPPEIYFDEYQKSSIKYKKNDINKVSPFMRVHKNISLQESPVKGIDFEDMSFHFINSTECVLDVNDNETYCTYKLIPSTDNITIFCSDEYADIVFNYVKDREIENFMGVETRKWYKAYPTVGNFADIREIPVTTKKIGTIEIRNDKKKVIVRGDCYQDEFTFVLDIGSENPDGTGEHYFAVFSK